MTLSPEFLQKLTRSRLRPVKLMASVGIGERPSHAKGSGMEFTDHREYQPGDDLRHVDTHLFARLGDYYVREYQSLMQLPIALVIDGSTSMTLGEPRKLVVAQWLAQALGFIGLAGSDRVQGLFWSGKSVEISTGWQGGSRAHRMFEWIDNLESAGAAPFEEGLEAIGRHIQPNSLVIVLSDWWLEEVEDALSALGATRNEVWGVQVLTAEELDPAPLGASQAAIVDAESGNALALSLDSGTLAAYRNELAHWRSALQHTLESYHGRYISVQTGDDLETLIWHEFRDRRLIE